MMFVDLNAIFTLFYDAKRCWKNRKSPIDRLHRATQARVTHLALAQRHGLFQRQRKQVATRRVVLVQRPSPVEALGSRQPNIAMHGRGSWMRYVRNVESVVRGGNVGADKPALVYTD